MFNYTGVVRLQAKTGLTNPGLPGTFRAFDEIVNLDFIIIDFRKYKYRVLEVKIESLKSADNYFLKSTAYAFWSFFLLMFCFKTVCTIYELWNICRSFA